MDIIPLFLEKSYLMLYIIIPILVVYVLLSAVYKVFRLYFVVIANCWFCNKNTKVLYDKRNSFICPSCEQYNGFKEDGDYNCELTEQFKETNKNFSYTFRPFKKHNSKKQSVFNHSFQNGLCDSCNFNQALKVRSLADFSESYRKNEDIDNFRKKLDEMYALCKDCEVKLHQVLGIQDSWLKPKLLGWKIHKTKLMKNIFFRNSSHNILRRIYHLSNLLAAILVVSNVLSCLIHSFPMIFEGIQQPQLINYLLKIDFYIATGGLLIVFYHFLRKDRTNKSLGFRLLFSWSVLAASLAYSLQEDAFLPKDQLKYCLLPLTVLNFINVAHSSKNRLIKVRTKKFGKSSSPSVISSFTMTTPEVEITDASQDLSDCFDVQSAISSDSINSNASKSTVSQKEEVIVDDDFSLKGLKIGTPKKLNCSKAASIFSLPSSSTSSGKRKKLTRHNIIQPAKFCSSITQASWVAGGVWGGSPRKALIKPPKLSVSRGNSQERDLFSRSSSKSSGFISQQSEVNDLPGWTSCSSSSFHDLSVPHSLTPTSYRFVASKRRYHPQDAVDAQSACSLQSFYTSPPPSEREWSSFNSLKTPQNINTTIKEVQFNWFNLCISFFFGFSLAANIFLCVLYLKSGD